MDFLFGRRVSPWELERVLQTFILISAGGTEYKDRVISAASR